MRLNAPVIGMAVAGNGAGYWLVGEDGGVFTFGDGLQFYGSAAGQVPAGRRVTQLVGMPNGDGYRMLALDRAPTSRSSAWVPAVRASPTSRRGSSRWATGPAASTVSTARSRNKRSGRSRR